MRVDLDAAVLGERATQQPVVIAKRCPIAVAAAAWSLDVREQGV
jgi:hypothetical protein